MPHRRSRKRNKSSPLVQSSPKKSKPPQADSNSDLDIIQDITEAEGSTDSGSEPELDSDTGSQTHLKSPTTDLKTTLTESSTMQATQASDHCLSQHASGVDLASQGSIPQNINQPPMVSPVIYSSQMSMPNTQQPQQLLAFQSPLPHPAPCMPGLTEQDLVRVAHLVKSILHEEIDLIVEARVNSATEPLKRELADMKAKYDKLQDEVNELQVKHDDMEQYSRRMCLRISGIPEAENEDVTKLVLDFANRVNANVGPSDIDRAHRVGRSVSTYDGNERSSRRREIIIKFTNSSARLSLLKGRAKLREDHVINVFINEDLTPARKSLAYECRRIKRLQTSKVKKTWVYAGYPHILDDIGKKVKITCLSDLEPFLPEGGQPSRV